MRNKKKPEGMDSIRGFAKLVGYSEGYIRKAIKDGKIKMGVHFEGDQPFIIPVVAAKEMNATLTYEKVKNHKAINKIKEVAKTAKPKPEKKPKAVKKKQPEVSEFLDDDLFEVDETPEPVKVQEQVFEISELLDDDLEFADFAEAKRIESVYKAKILKLDYQEKLKNLVPVEKVNRALYEAGQSVRDAFTSLADKWIDQIVNASNRNEAYKILRGAVNECLETLSSSIEKVENNV